MNHLYFNIFIFNRIARLSYLVAFIALSSLFFNALPSFAGDGYKITSHYYLPIPEKKGEYYNAIQWDINNSNEWINFVNNLQTLPREDKVTNPFQINLPDIIHVEQINPDKISGSDVYMSKAGIHLVTKMPFDLFYFTNPKLIDFLESQLKEKSSYTETEDQEININSAGIVVTYRGSNTLGNPTWHISSDEDLADYKRYIDELVPIERKTKLRIEEGKEIYDELGSFVLYLNYPDAPSKILSISRQGDVRATKVETLKYLFKDTQGFYDIYKKRAGDIVKGNEARRSGKSLTNEGNQF